MTTRKFGRTALIAVLALSIIMSITGGTIAWFTDEVTSANNVITSGNLDIELYHTNKTITAEEKVGAATELFDDVTRWEPGVVSYENLTIKNEGNLALKYVMTINATNENTVNGNGLSTALKVALVEGGVTATERETLLSSIPAGQWTTFAQFKASGALLPKDSTLELPDGVTADKETKTYGLVIYWQPGTDDNKWNVNNGKTVSDYVAGQNNNYLHIDLGVKLNATQLTAEDDAFGSDYDAAAHWADISWYTANPDATEFTINSFEELAGLAQIVNGTAANKTQTAEALHDDFAGKTVKLGANIDLKNIEWTPIGRIGVTSTDFTYAFRGTFDGANYTVSNLKVSNEGWAGLFGIAYKADLKNVNLKDVTLNSSRMTGSLVGQLYGSIENCHVNGAEIKVVPNAVANGFDNGDKVGGIVGWLGDNGNNRTLKGCSATNVNLTAYRDVGGIAGYVASSTNVNNNTSTSVTININQNKNYYGVKDFNAGLIYGRKGGNITESGNTAVNGNIVLVAVPAAYANETYNIPEGVTVIGSYAFAYNDNIKKIVLPSTVTTLNDRAFRDTSASEVVLNEGLTNISYQAFRNASNVTSVEIPSTVTTISKEAFQNSGIKTLTIPATVTTLEYGGCRDMKKLETVIIKGNLDIPVYAFRACTNLKTVVLEGEDVTFGGGSSGMIFTTKENGDGSAITIYVANETVKGRLLAADTAAKDYGGYKIEIGNFPSI
ncbi:MAG: leucine-rich repeat protein [Clostridia bacterium]|nr:leucine-rich repeat protein [Clostridia bacterium]